jgi:glutaminyl-tRNA synthetase (EC 6.1.1.18)
MGRRQFDLTAQVWIEREDFMEVPPKGYHRLTPGGLAAEIRLRDSLHRL